MDDLQARPREESEGPLRASSAEPRPLERLRDSFAHARVQERPIAILAVQVERLEQLPPGSAREELQRALRALLAERAGAGDRTLARDGPLCHAA
jgi:hypothetical protein